MNSQVKRGWVWKIVPGGYRNPDERGIYSLEDVDPKNYYKGYCPLCWNGVRLDDRPYPASTVEEENRIIHEAEEAHVCGELNPDGADIARLLS
jgi:hypothetical protein